MTCDTCGERVDAAACLPCDDCRAIVCPDCQIETDGRVLCPDCAPAEVPARKED